ncbi:MarR family winged helix-turn-helix transcriptional regulator [Streptomyces sp. NPDC085946]|uniref:MarR family winged helix-turn-helix transcriptional regulator n=1 Tax=Streptomyces sp. NPDC085946 TaxID=3365744 RepID=UPI0037D09398
MPEADSVDVATEQWAAACPRLDVSPGEVLARVQRLAQLIDEAQTRRLRRRTGLVVNNLGDFDVLRALRRVGPPYALTPTRLRQAMLVSGAGLSGRLKRLEKDGWITRAASPDDGRSSLVRLTPEGVADLDRDLEDHYAFESDLLRSLDLDRRGRMADDLRTLLLDFEKRF